MIQVRFKHQIEFKSILIEDLFLRLKSDQTTTFTMESLILAQDER